MVTNKEVLQIVAEERTILDTIPKRKPSMLHDTIKENRRNSKRNGKKKKAAVREEEMPGTVEENSVQRKMEGKV